jgi:hypothetical protein
MSGAFWLIAIPTACYAGTALVYATKGDWASVAIFAGYSLANCGFLVIEWAK